MLVIQGDEESYDLTEELNTHHGYIGIMLHYFSNLAEFGLQVIGPHLLDTIFWHLYSKQKKNTLE